MTDSSVPDDTADTLRWLLSPGGDNASASRKPLGNRDTVVGLLAESLPRLTVDDAGKGTFKRGRAQLIVQLVGDPVRAIELMLRAEHVTAFRPPLERVALKAGWQLVDPDRGEILFPVPKEDSSGSTIGRAAVALLTIAAIAGVVWWISLGPTDDNSVAGLARRQRAAAAAAAAPATPSPGMPPTGSIAAGPGGVPTISPEELVAQIQQVGEIMRRQRSLAPAFRGMRVVNEMLTVSSAEFQFSASAGNGLFVDPVVLANLSKNPGGRGIPGLPVQFAELSRGGYRFSFSGRSEGKPFFEEFRPSYQSFVYVATPEPGETSRYSFALFSDTGRIHYSTDGRTPTATDPSVTDSVAVEAPEAIRDVEATPNEGGVVSRLRAFINGFFRSKPGQDAQLAYHEDRAIRDLRAFAAAQTALLTMFAGQGYGSPEVLSEPSILPGAPAIPPFLDRSFSQEVREGYRFSFVGKNPASGSGRATLYGDYNYAATPVGSAPIGRRSFAVFPDGVVRFRRDGAPPQKSDPILGSEK
jgi:hypothetical protein